MNGASHCIGHECHWIKLPYCSAALLSDFWSEFVIIWRSLNPIATSLRSARQMGHTDMRAMQDSMEADVSPRSRTRAAVRELELPPAQLAALVARIAQGQQSALNELYEVTVAKLFGLARLILRNNADAEEVVCDTYAQIWDAAARFDASRGSVLGWMLTICRSRALDLMRQRHSRARTADGFAREPQGNLDECGPDALLSALQEGTSVRRALAALSPIRRQLITLAFLQGLSHHQIVEQTGLPMGTVKSHIRRALTALREELKIWEEHEEDR
jgi:RNA polymerase sigma factor (sigma-70 family)